MQNNKKNIVRAAVVAASFAFIFYGITRGETSVVLNKAVNICLECIGLG
ncbi:MAG: thioredoxin [Lachnospiraceae bacterium]